MTKRDADNDGGLAGWLRTLALTLAIVLVPRVVLCQPFTIPSGSMEPTLQVGDYILVSKYAYGWSRHSIPLSPPLPQGRLLGQAPARGDIVVFKKPNDGRTDIIKRLIGLPGDKVQVVEGVLRINDRPVRREWLGTTVEAPFGEMIPVGQFKETLPGGKAYVTNSWGSGTPGANTGVYTVPQGCFFMMGDNRDNSLDSRFDAGAIPKGEAACKWDAALDAYLPPELGMGYVPADDLVGRAEMVVGSMRPGASVLKPWTLVSHMRWERTFHRLGGSV
ncbi:signal peptidase I [Caulobacter soli]|uniref:signal peptidase I n=1 Tax=Caulobacter soli TaxID=2708539 RepID=UPI0013EA7AA1|nr:signal peptidase I [Caulobacter soli]